MRTLPLALCLAVACSSTSGPAPPGAHDLGAAVDSAGAEMSLAIDMTSCMDNPPSVDAGAPPKVTCGGDAGGCALPPSVCVDGTTLMYYTDGSCQNGVCAWHRCFLQCPNGSPCSGGGCSTGFT